MGARGKQPMPTALRVLTGERHADRYNDAEPEPPQGRLECPEDVSDRVRDIWETRLNFLEQMNLAYPSDADAWRGFCETVDIHERACRQIAVEELLIESGRGGWAKNPILQVQRDAALALLRFATVFGLTPSARSSIRATPKNEETSPNPFASTG